MGVTEDLERIALQERELVLPCLDAEIAWKLGAYLRALAHDRGLAVTIDIRRQRTLAGLFQGSASAAGRE